ncbi:hypothetical protein FDX20_27890, partial [Citrobacter sp. TBCS-11]
MEKTNRDLIYCQKVLQLLEDLAKVEQNIEFFSEHSNKQRIRRRQGKSLFIKLVLFIATGCYQRAITAPGALY